jgi:hypothetical protein
VVDEEKRERQSHLPLIASEGAEEGARERRGGSSLYERAGSYWNAVNEDVTECRLAGLAGGDCVLEQASSCLQAERAERDLG